MYDLRCGLWWVLEDTIHGGTITLTGLHDLTQRRRANHLRDEPWTLGVGEIALLDHD